MYKHISDFVGKCNDYMICFNTDEQKYCAIKTCDVSYGKVTRPYRNFELMWSDTWQGTVAQVEQEDNVQYVAKCYNVPMQVSRAMVVFGMSFTDAWNDYIRFETLVNLYR